MVTEKRLIYKEDVIELAWLDHECEVVTLSDIEDMKPADAMEVVHGQWEPDIHPYDNQPYRDKWYGYMFKCSVCGGTTMGDYDLLCHDKYCPNCGAKMDGGIDK